EEPILSHRLITEKQPIPSCSHCMRTFLSPEQAFPHNPKLLDEGYDYVKNPVECNFCTIEKYCSEKCKTTAWNQYHQILCIGDKNQTIQGEYHPMLVLYGLVR